MVRSAGILSPRAPKSASQCERQATGIAQSRNTILIVKLSPKVEASQGPGQPVTGRVSPVKGGVDDLDGD